MLRLMRKGQSTAEYAIVIGLVIAAAVAMQIYIKRQLQGKVKDAVDYNETADHGLTSAGTQYDPYYQTSTNVTSASDRTQTIETFAGGKVKRNVAVGADKSTRTGTTNILADTAAP